MKKLIANILLLVFALIAWTGFIAPELYSIDSTAVFFGILLVWLGFGFWVGSIVMSIIQLLFGVNQDA